MTESLSVMIQLVTFKYGPMPEKELANKINLEFNKSFSEQDILNFHVDLVELELLNRKIENYGQSLYSGFEFLDIE